MFDLNEPASWTVAAARRALDAGEIASIDLTRALLDRISAVESGLGALLTVTGERAISDAAAADARIQAGEREPLLGIPVVLKDIFATRGIRTTCASR